MRRVLVVLAVLGAVVVAARRHYARPQNKGAFALAILKDVAEVQSRDVSWHVHSKGRSSATLWQHERVELRGNAGSVHVVGDSWDLSLELSTVFAIRCRIYGGDVGEVPEYGFITFMPEGGDVFDTLFEVGFPEPSIDALERICAKHGLRVER